MGLFIYLLLSYVITSYVLSFLFIVDLIVVPEKMAHFTIKERVVIIVFMPVMFILALLRIIWEVSVAFYRRNRNV